MREQEFLDFARVDVLAAADDHVLDPPGDAETSVGQPHGQIAGVQPTLGIDGGGRGLGIVIVAQHDDVPPRAQFALLIVGQRGTAQRIGNLHFHAGERPADRLDAQLERVVGPGLGDHRRGLGLAVRDRDLAHAHPIDDLLHDLDRAGAAGHDARPQRTQIMRIERGVVELGDVHGGDAVDRGGMFPFDGVERGPGIERLGRNDHCGPVHDGRQSAQHAAEAVVKRHRDANPVGVGEMLAPPDVESVQQQVAVAQHRRLGKSRGAGSVLDVDRLIRCKRTCDFVQPGRGHVERAARISVQVMPPAGALASSATTQRSRGKFGLCAAPGGPPANSG